MVRWYVGVVDAVLAYWRGLMWLMPMGAVQVVRVTPPGFERHAWRITVTVGARSCGHSGRRYLSASSRLFLALSARLLASGASSLGFTHGKRKHVPQRSSK